MGGWFPSIPPLVLGSDSKHAHVHFMKCHEMITELSD